jgi:hypothetical protein
MKKLKTQKTSEGVTIDMNSDSSRNNSQSIYMDLDPRNTDMNTSRSTTEGSGLKETK